MSQIALCDSSSVSVSSNEATVVEIVEDLDSMKLSEKTPPSLSTMPLAVLHNILDHVKPIDRLVVRKVSRRFRDTVDDHDPGFKEMVVLTGAREDFILKFDDFCVFYCRNGAGCSIKFNMHGALREKKIKNGSYLKLASTDLKMIINNPKLRLESFELDFVKIPYTADQKANMEVVQMLLKSPKLKIIGFHQEQIPMVLQYFERDHIQELNGVPFPCRV